MVPRSSRWDLYYYSNTQVLHDLMIGNKKQKQTKKRVRAHLEHPTNNPFKVASGVRHPQGDSQVPEQAAVHSVGQPVRVDHFNPRQIPDLLDRCLIYTRMIQSAGSRPRLLAGI